MYEAEAETGEGAGLSGGGASWVVDASNLAMTDTCSTGASTGFSSHLSSSGKFAAPDFVCDSGLDAILVARAAARA